MKVLDEILPNNLWYIIGYIVADGNLSKSGRHISIVSKDIEHLIKIRQALQIDCKIGMFANGGSCEKKYGRIQFSNINFYKFLNDIGITKSKSFTIGPLAIDRVYAADFVRGVIDGDGSIRRWEHSSNGLVQWSTSIFGASENFIIWIKELIEKEFSIKGKVHVEIRKSPRKPLFTLKFGKLASQVLLGKIYYDKCLCLKRKDLLAKACLLDPKKMLNYNSVISSDGGIGIRVTLKM